MFNWNFWSQRPRKSPPAVMSTSRETPCINHRRHGDDFNITSHAAGPWDCIGEGSETLHSQVINTTNTHRWAEGNSIKVSFCYRTAEDWSNNQKATEQGFPHPGPRAACGTQPAATFLNYVLTVRIIVSRMGRVGPIDDLDLWPWPVTFEFDLEPYG